MQIVFGSTFPSEVFPEECDLVRHHLTEGEVKDLLGRESFITGTFQSGDIFVMVDKDGLTSWTAQTDHSPFDSLRK